MRLIDADALIERVKAAPIREKNKVIGLIHTERTAPVKTGKWETDELPMGCVVGYWCSECGEQHDYKTPYCPNCGARMEPQ